MSSAPARAADVVVIGCGAAGLSAAIEAADRGAQVIVIESEASPAGSTRLSAGYAAFCETDLAPGPREELYQDLLEAHHGDHDEALVRLYVDHAAATYRRLLELGVRFAGTFQFAHMHRPWAHEVAGPGVHGGAELGRLLEIAARERGVEILTSSRGRRLVRDEHGRVDAVMVDTPGGALTLAVNRAVVLASGGFTRNPALIRNYGRPGTERILPITGAGSRGDGLTMALALGADTTYMAAGIAPTGPADPVTAKGAMLVYSGAVILNRDGRRFCDESGLYNDISWAALEQPEALIFQIYDEAIRDAHLRTMLGRVLSGYAEYKAETMEALLALLQQAGGLDAGQAKLTVEAYNGAVRRGDDPGFGRRHLVGTSGTPPAIASGPFYGIVTVPGTTHFNGGLKVDTALRVIDVFGEPIAGLYAAGEVTGGFHGSGYLSASHVGMALIFGQLAGQNAMAGA
ncbi:FAD-dependent oxidoreductase [Bosea sp. (in: a-proteobacteria)]|uniref:FAD-dependent oxidoreductase n=1 Tax=Bosea sp. (in: a-proteobacteria) TaxID=1871050 RepID=UPI002FCC22DA